MRKISIIGSGLLVAIVISTASQSHAQSRCFDLLKPEAHAKSSRNRFSFSVPGHTQTSVANQSRAYAEHLQKLNKLIATRTMLQQEVEKRQSTKKKLFWVATLGQGDKQLKAELNELAQKLSHVDSEIKSANQAGTQLTSALAKAHKDIIAQIALVQFQNSLIVIEGAKFTANAETISFDSETGEFNVKIDLRLGDFAQQYEMRVGFKETRRGLSAYAFLLHDAKAKPESHQPFRRGAFLKSEKFAGRRVLQRVTASSSVATKLATLGVKLSPAQEERIRIQIMNSSIRARELRTLVALAEKHRRANQWTADQQSLISAALNYYAYGPALNLKVMPTHMWLGLYMTNPKAAEFAQSLQDLTQQYLSSDISERQFSSGVQNHVSRDFPGVVNFSATANESPELQSIVTLDNKFKDSAIDYLALDNDAPSIANDTKFESNFEDFARVIEDNDIPGPSQRPSDTIVDFFSDVSSDPTTPASATSAGGDDFGLSLGDDSTFGRPPQTIDASFDDLLSLP